ncbi:MAG: hypothetical protein ACLUAR_10380 [Pilosibacter sp.]
MKSCTEKIGRSPDLFDPGLRAGGLPFLDGRLAVHRGHSGLE